MPITSGGISKFDEFPIFDGPAGDVALTLDGYTIQGSIGSWGIVWEPPGTRLLMADGTFCSQINLPKPKQPVTMEARRGSFDLQVYHLDDFIRLRRAGSRSGVLAFLGEPHDEEWLIANADSGQTEWRTSRRIGWNGTSRTHLTHPPYAAIQNGSTITAQTIVTSGTPASGEVKVPTVQTAGQFYDSITTPAGITGDRLIFRYWPEMVVTVRVSNAVSASGVYVLSLEIEESLHGVY